MPPSVALLAYAYAKSGDTTKAMAILEGLMNLRKDPQTGYAPPFLVAYIHEGLGNTDAALDWLELAMEERDGWLIYLNSFPRFDSLRDEDRFRDILNRLHLPETNL